VAGPYASAVFEEPILFWCRYSSSTRLGTGDVGDVCSYERRRGVPFPSTATPNVSPGGASKAIHIRVTGSALSGMASSPLVLSPAFSPSDTDYVWYCAGGTNQLTLQLSSDGTITSRGETGSAISLSVSVVNNQGTWIAGSTTGSRPARTVVNSDARSFPERRQRLTS
jgi:hypothetical protein